MNLSFRCLWVASIAGFGLFAPIASAQTLDEIQKSFTENYDALNNIRDEQLQRLSASYEGVLTKLLKKLIDTGDLDAVLPVRDELAAVQKGTWPLRDLPKASPEPLPAMRKKFVGARETVVKDHGEDLVALAGRMEKLLHQREVALTRAGDLENALAARKMRTTLVEDRALIAAKKSIAQPDQGPIGEQEWIPLIKSDVEIVVNQGIYAGPIGGVGYDRIKPGVRTKLEAVGGAKKSLCVLLAPTLAEFCFPRRVTELQGEACVLRRKGGGGGGVQFTIRSGSREIESFIVSARKDAMRKFSCKFPPTDRITVETKDLHNDGNEAFLLGALAR